MVGGTHAGGASQVTVYSISIWSPLAQDTEKSESNNKNKLPEGAVNDNPVKSLLPITPSSLLYNIVPVASVPS